MARKIFSYYKKSLIDLITSVQELNREPENNLPLCKEIQLSLIDKIFQIEYKIRHLRNELEMANKQLHSKQQQPLTKDQSRNLKEKINAIEERIQEYHDLRRAYKSIGDAIAFTYMDKWDIKQFAQKEDVGFISGKDGYKLEIECFHGGFDHGFITILHDITNCLKHADISYTQIGKPIFTFECKSRKGYSKRGERQLDNIQEIYDFLRTDEKVVNDHKVMRIGFRNSEISYAKLITQLIEKSIDKGAIFQKVENGFYYLITTHSSNFDELLADIPKQGHFMINILNDMKYNSFGYMPFTLTIQNAEYVYKFYKGDFLICIFIDMEEIRNLLLKKDISLEIMEGDDYIFRFVRGYDGLEYRVSKYFFLRIPYEFLSLHWFIQEIAELYENPSEKILSFLEGKD